MDPFIFRKSTFLPDSIPLLVRLLILRIALITGVYLLKSGHVIVIHEQHPAEVVSSGAFKYKRHPLYLGVIMFYLGLTVALLEGGAMGMIANIKPIVEMLVDLATILAIIIGAIWAWYKWKRYREAKYCIDFSLDAKIINLKTPVEGQRINWICGERTLEPKCKHTHAIEIYLHLKNLSKIRFTLHNIDIAIQTLRPPGETTFDKSTGHLSMQRIFTSGNITSRYNKNTRKCEPFSYYIEPGVTQTITYLALVSEPRELLQIIGAFSLEQERIFPGHRIGKLGLFPHTAVKTYQVDSKVDSYGG